MQYITQFFYPWFNSKNFYKYAYTHNPEMSYPTTLNDGVSYAAGKTSLKVFQNVSSAVNHGFSSNCLNYFSLYNISNTIPACINGRRIDNYTFEQRDKAK